MRRRTFVMTVASATVASPISSRGQQGGHHYRIGLLTAQNFSAGTNPARLADELVRLLSRTGFTAGSNLDLVKRGADAHYDRLPSMVAELIAAKVDVIVTFGYPAAAAAKEGASTVPVVVVNAGDPVKTRLVASLGRPGGNVTGLSDVAAELAPKRLELLKETAPGLRRVAMLWNAQDLGMTTRYQASVAAAQQLGVSVQSLGVREPDDFGNAFEEMARSMPDGLLMVADALTFLNRKRVFDFATEHRLPAIYETDSFVRDGGLVSYGPDETEIADRTASLLARILKGERPADLPLEQPTRYRFVVNLKTAKSLGLTMPALLLARADEVIE